MDTKERTNDCDPLKLIERFLARGAREPDLILIHELERCRRSHSHCEELGLLNECISYFYVESRAGNQNFRASVMRLASVLKALTK